jgi:hypothetical protein
MHGTEQCDRKPRAFRLSATPQPFYGLWDRRLQARRTIAPARDRSLVTAFCSPAKAAPSRSLRHGVKAPGLLLRFLPHVTAARSDPRSTVEPDKSRSGCFTARIPLQRSRALLVAALPDCLPFGTFTSLGIENKTGWASTRSTWRIRPIPFAPRCRCFHVQQRITVPESLRFRRLAVPQTSWNLLHYALGRRSRQTLSMRPARFSTTFI